MGLFNEAHQGADQPDGDAEPATRAQRDAEAARAAADRPVDLNDPTWAPVQGITLDKYAQLTAAMAREDLGTPEATEAWLEDHGVAPGTWAEVQAGWVNRMATHEAVRTRYGVLYSRS